MADFIQCHRVSCLNNDFSGNCTCKPDNITPNTYDCPKYGDENFYTLTNKFGPGLVYAPYIPMTTKK